MYSKQELIEKLREMMDARSDDLQTATAVKISENVLDPAWSNWVFHSAEFALPDGSLDYERLAEKILSYRAIRL